MKIFIGTDHAGYVLKEKLVTTLQGEGHEVVDKGAYDYDEHDDYPDFIIPVAQEVSKNSNSMGITLGATGESEAIAANRFPNVRAVVYYGEGQCVVDDEANIIVRAREHANSNMLCLGARFLTEDQMVAAVDLWIKTPFNSTQNHVRRLAKIDAINVK